MRNNTTRKICASGRTILALFSIFALLIIVDVEVSGFTRKCATVRTKNRRLIQKSLIAYSRARFCREIYGSSDNDGLFTNKLSTSAVATSAEEDPYEAFPLFDKILFKLFSASVTAEMQKSSDEEPKSYNELMRLINEMTTTRSTQKVNDQGKNMLKRLFPAWLLTQYKWMFAAPFPEVFLRFTTVYGSRNFISNLIVFLA